jgi:actin-related protein 5
LGFGEVLGAGQSAAPTKQLTAEDYQLHLGVERVRVPELLMQPAALAGVDQGGLPEVVGLVLRRLPKHVREAVAAGGVVVTGGNALFAGA